jgi:hypothetical protein
MSNSESDGPSENEWDDRGELAWNEFDWENYLREQDEVLSRYLAFYEKFKDRADRIDHVAHLMGWDEESWSAEEDELSPASRERTLPELESKTELGSQQRRESSTIPIPTRFIRILSSWPPKPSTCRSNRRG